MKIKTMHEEHKRSALKTISWRIIATSTTMFLVYIFTGQLELSAGVGIGDVVLKMVFYFLHERFWNRVAFGRSLGGTVDSVMRSPPATALPLDVVSEVVQKMITFDIDAVVVSEGQKHLGLITEKDILKKVLNSSKNLDETYAKDIMSSPLATVDYDKSLVDVLKIMNDKQIRRLVVTKEGKAVGIVTERRILEALIQKRE